MFYKLSPDAVRDMEDIWRHTAEKWGVAQAMRYFELLHSHMELVAAMPDTGRRRDELRKGYRSVLAGMHVVFYRLQDGRVEVARVLHQHMDFPQHLS